jgi:hypothetical protein
VYSKCLEPTSKSLNLPPDAIPPPFTRIKTNRKSLNIEMQHKTSSPSSISSLDNYENLSPSKQKNASPSFETWQTLTFTPPSSLHTSTPTLPSHEDNDWEIVRNDFLIDAFVLVNDKTDECKNDLSENSNVSKASICPLLPVSWRGVDRESGSPVPLVNAVAGLISKLGVMYNE